ncbi:NAD(P)H-binding protein [Sporichthya brevicatena]|uniref:NAD(P)H-binding protein n=1 Tax=Sporichthya brevicatena TaxID=171442 RepID=A0ABP3RD50_9ACTN
MKIAVAGSTGMVGRKLVALATAQGHEVVGLARSTGYDLLAPVGLEEALAGVDAVVDVTQGPALDEKEATEFFVTVAENLGKAASAAGVGRTVVLSIVGVDRSPDYGYYVAKLAQEEATRATAPGPLVVRATQFHEFPGQMLEWNRDGDVVRIVDVPTQPVSTDEVVALLLEAATGQVDGDVDLAGPQVERLVDLVERVVARTGERVRVEAVPAPASMAGGSMVPGPGALRRGPDWDTWFAAR